MHAGEEIAELRKRAQWYRDFASVGSADNRELRLALARHFEQRARELEERRKKDEK